MSRSARAGRRWVMLTSVAAVSLLAAAGCGGSDGDDAADTSTTASDPTTTASDGTTTTADPGAASDAWILNAQEHRGQDGTTVEYDCPAGGTLGSLWGTETYTDDSSVCTAAVHVGLITVEDGGTVSIEVAPGEESYEAGEANGVISSYYGPYTGSFTFPDAPPGSGEFEAPAASWSQTASGLALGDRRTLDCATDGTAGSVWGTGTYTTDSSICTAAVLEGLITLDGGGRVTIEVVDGEDAYVGSQANGITSQDYQSYPRSYEFPEDQPED